MTRIVVLTALASMALSGCRFEEPEPSEAVYKAAVADMPPRPQGHLEIEPTAPVAPAPDVDPVARAAAHAGSANGFHVVASGREWAFRPPNDLLVRNGATVLGMLGGRCVVRSGLVTYPCNDAETAQARGLLRAARAVHLTGLREHEKVTPLSDTSFRVGDDVEVNLDPASGRIRTVLLRGETELEPVIAVAERTPPPASVFAQLASPQAGAPALITVPDQYAACARAPGDPGRIGSTVRQLVDWAAEHNAKVDERAGVLLEQEGDGWRACLVLAQAVPGAQRLSGGPMLRVWHRGVYDGLLARRDALQAEARSRGLTAASGRGLRAVLYHDPEAVPASDRVSALLLPVLQ